MAYEDVNAVASVLKGILEQRNNPAANLAEVAYNASQRADPPIYVVPDRPQYGAEVTLNSMINLIDEHRAKNPVYMPFEPGTKTMAGKQFDAQQAAQDFSREVTEAELTGLYKGKPTLEAQRLAITAAKSGGSGGSGGAIERPLDPQKALEQMAFERYVKGEATQDDLVLLGLMNRPSPPREDTQQGDSTEQLLGLLGQMGDDTEPEALKEAKNSVDYALGMGLSVQEIERSINSQRSELLAEGVDPDEVIKYLYKQRPWWQKAIDILPGRQFR